MKCRGDYCKVHLAKIQKNKTIPVPRRICEKGTQSAIEFCSDCSLVRVSRGEYNEMKKENDRLITQNNYLNHVLEQQTDEVNEININCVKKA